MVKICTECQIELRPKENGIALVAMAVYGPLSVSSADLFECPGCGATAIFGIGNAPEMMGEGVKEFLFENRGRRVIEYWTSEEERNASHPLSYFLESR